MIICIIIIIIIIIIALITCAGNYFYNLAINPAISKDKVFGSDEDKEDDKVKLEETSREDIKEDKEWIIKHSGYKDLYVTSVDNLKLHAYEIKNYIQCHKWTIVVHGYCSEGNTMGSRAKVFYELGHNVIIPDLRGHGQSEGHYIGMGWHDRQDILTWINYIIKQDKNSEIILYGISMGASTVMMTCGEELPSNVKVAVEDCGYTSAWDEFSYQLKLLFKMPKFPIMNFASIVTKIRAGYDFKQASALKQVAKSKIPILFIHGSNDDFVPYSMRDKLYAAANCEKQRLTIEGAAHCKSYIVDSKLYWSTIINFIDKYVLLEEVSKDGDVL